MAARLFKPFGSWDINVHSFPRSCDKFVPVSNLFTRLFLSHLEREQRLLEHYIGKFFEPADDFFG